MYQSAFEKLLTSEPLGFIDPLTDLGEFDPIQMKFKEPVRQLVNKYSGQPYSAKWQEKIESMRTLYIQYQISLREEEREQSIRTRIRNKQSKEHVHNIVTTYLKLGFRFKEIESKISLSNTRLRRNWKRSDYVTTTEPVFYLKKDLQKGYCSSTGALPRSMRIN